MSGMDLMKPAVPHNSSNRMRIFRRNPMAFLCGALILAMAFTAILAPELAPYHYDYEDTAHYSSFPSPPDHRHLLGTDNLGQDVLSRLIYGAGISLGVALVAVTIEALLGLPLGLAAGYYGGKTDAVLMRFTDVMFAFPDLLLAILLRAVLSSGVKPLPAWLNLASLFLALGVVGWPPLTRLVRGQALAIREMEFIEAARAVGSRDRTILFRHLLPNLLGPVIVQITQDIAGVILAEATLSFLGLGVQPPYPSWGRMISDALPYKEVFPLLLLAPGLALTGSVLLFNFFGDALRDLLDPRERR